MEEPLWAIFVPCVQPGGRHKPVVAIAFVSPFGLDVQHLLPVAVATGKSLSALRD